MPLWDSVQRGLEKASQEASRMARTQRLRSSIDGLYRQVNTEQGHLISKTKELFSAGQITQPELLQVCQELARLQQQLQQEQMELKQLQINQPAQPAGSQPGMPSGSAPYPPQPQPITGQPVPYTPINEDLPDTVYALIFDHPISHKKSDINEDLPDTVYAPPPPNYPSYSGTSTSAAEAPLPPTTYPPYENTSDVAEMETVLAPPPPGVEPLTISSIETIAGQTPDTPSAPAGPQRCSNCQAELVVGHAFCHNCGSPVQKSQAEHLPTMRAGTLEAIYGEGQETVRAEAPPQTNKDNVLQGERNSSPFNNVEQDKGV